MNAKLLKSKTFEEWCESMDTNSEGGYYSQEAIEQKNDNPCYIPANADSLTDIVSYQDCLKGATNFVLENAESINEYAKEVGAEALDYTPEKITTLFFENPCQWLSFETWLFEVFL